MVSALGNHVQQMTTVQAADEGAACATLAQGICQCEAAHDLTCADLQRGVGAEGDFQKSTFVDKCIFFFIKYLC